MAGDWIKMRQDLHDDPAVVGMSGRLDLDEDTIIGKLHRIWCWADRHTTDGTAPAITPRWVDKYVGLSGFAEAMQAVGWLQFNDSGVTFPNFERHNGKSAKSRAENTTRQRLSREMRDNHVTGIKRGLIPRPFARHVMERDGFRCVYCGTQSSLEREQNGRRGVLSIDHMIPESRGGQTTVDNLVCCCRLCNNEKNDRTPEEAEMLPVFLPEGSSYLDGKIVTDLSRDPRDASSLLFSQSSASSSASSSKKKKRSGIAPTVDEVRAYCEERGNRIDAENFVAYYAKQGWVTNAGRPIKDWRSAVVQWEKRDRAAQSAQAAPKKTKTQETAERMRAALPGGPG